jgi:hypothetical protein
MKLRVASTHHESRRYSLSAITRLAEKQWRSARRNEELPHNKGLQPTANSMDVIRQLGGLLHCVRGG